MTRPPPRTRNHGTPMLQMAVIKFKLQASSFSRKHQHANSARGLYWTDCAADKGSLPVWE